MFLVNTVRLNGARLRSALSILTSSALLFLPHAGPVSAEAAPLESFALVTVFLEPDGKCFEARPGTFAFQNDCDYNEGQYWLSRPAADGGSFKLVTDIFPDLCLQATLTEGDSPEAQGAAFLAQCSEDPGQKWLFVGDGNEGSFQLKNFAGGADYCLEGNQPDPQSFLGGASYLGKCQNVTGQFWRVSGAEVVNGIPYPFEMDEGHSDETATEETAGLPPEAAAENGGDAVVGGLESEVRREPGPEVPAMTALQSCSVNDAICEPGVARGYYMATAPDSTGFILPLEADDPKPQLVVEHFPQEDGTVAVAFRDTSGRYLVIDPNNGFTASFTAPSAADENTQFLVVAALDSPEQGFASFVPRLYPEKYLRHSGFVLYAHDSDNSSLFNRDASWRIVGLE